MPRATPERKGDPVPPQSGENRPVHTIRHRSIKASIWRNATAKGPVYNVIVVRGFKDGDVWKDMIRDSKRPRSRAKSRG
jgi:hypothetical protein